jgi:hypothetical protein
MFERRKAPSIRRGLALGGAVLALSLAACSGIERGPAVPASESGQVTVLGIPNARFWPDTQGDDLVREAIDARNRELPASGAAVGQLPAAYFLAISGGSDNGAFGSGLLCRWVDSGTMPAFKLVTGVSTGSMLAPFAYLGRAYRDQLCSLYTSISAADVLRARGLYGILFSDALADTTPLANLIARYVTPQMLTDIAAEYHKGRLLMIGTTSLDVQRPVFWNIGAIAASGRPEALELVRNILRASAAIPGAFPPVMIDVEADGRRYQEMNVDGGAVAQTFLYPPDLGLRVNLKARENQRDRHAYIIRNGRLDPDWADVERKFVSIVGRAISTMIHYSGYNDVLRIYATTQRDGVDYNLAYIEPDFRFPRKEDFDPAYMRALFDYGYAKGGTAGVWHKSPPVLDIKNEASSP